MGHAASRNRTNRRYKKKGIKSWRNSTSKWKDEDLGKKVSALLESNAHRRDAVILPSTDELVQSYHASRRSSAVNPVEPKNWVRLSFNGEKDHKNWLKQQDKMHNSDNLVVPNGVNGEGGSNSSGSEHSGRRGRYSRIPRQRPKIIMNWLRDLEILISDDESEDRMNENSSPVFGGKLASLEEEWDQDMMVSTEISSALALPERKTKGVHSEGGIRGDKEPTETRTKTGNGVRGKLDLTTSAGVEPSYLMGAASSIKVLPTLPRKYRKDKGDANDSDSDAKHVSEHEDEKGVHGISTNESSPDQLASSERESEEDDSYSPPWENEDEPPKPKIIFSRLKPKGLKSNSFTGFRRKNFGLSAKEYDSEYRKIKLREQANFTKALRNSSPSGEYRHRHLRAKRDLFWSDQLSNFSLSSPTGRRKNYEREVEYDRYGRYVLPDPRRRRPKFTLSPPSSHGFDPYADAYVAHEQNDNPPTSAYKNEVQRVAVPGRSYYYYDTESDFTSLPDSDESETPSTKYASRLWQRQDFANKDDSYRLYDAFQGERKAEPKYRISGPAMPLSNNLMSHQRSASTAGGLSIYRSPRHHEGRRFASSSFFEDGARNFRRPLSDRMQYEARKPDLARLSSHGGSVNQFLRSYQIARKPLRDFRQNISNTSMKSGSIKTLSKTPSLSEIDPALENKMDAMVRDMIYGSIGKRKRAPKLGQTSRSSSKETSGMGSFESVGTNRSVGAIHERVASALASVLMSKSFPNAVDVDKK